MKIRLWKLGNLEHRIIPTKEAVDAFHGLLKGIVDDSTKTVADLVWDSAIDCILIDDGEDVVSTIDNEDGKIPVFSDILRRRIYQDEKWGGPEHDDSETQENWQSYITEYANATGRAEQYDFRKRMIDVAALAIAAVESHDRKATCGKEAL